MDMPKRVRIGDLLLERRLISQEQLSQALAEQKKTGKKLGRAITDLGFLTEETLLRTLADFVGYPFIELARFRVETRLVQLLPESQARRYRAVVLADEPAGLRVGMADPTDLMLLDEIQRALKRPILPAFVREQELLAVLDTQYRRQEQIASIAGELEGELQASDFDIDQMAMTSDSSEAPAVRLLQNLFEDAVQVKASDIHIEPEENLLRIRLRIDGDLQEQIMKERRVASALVSRLKIMSGLDISEKRLPQDGRFNIRVMNRSIDVRLSTMPVQFGESVVMRLLDQSTTRLELDSLGMPEAISRRFTHLIRRPHGLILVTGPTGSGKTTTLYSALNLLNEPGKKIITAEDPIEYRLPRINQVQVNPKVGLEFATVLRAALRQDPDILLVGEMRDQTTAEIGLRAAMTGHLVLSTLHTNDAASSAMRLLDMGVDTYLVASALRGVVAQRLIKRLCPNCQHSHHLLEQERSWLNAMEAGAGDQAYVSAKGCHQCHNTGYQGRIGIYELLEMTSPLIAALRQHNSHAFAEAAIAQKNFRPLALAALDFARQGLTSIEEVFRIAATLDESEG
ncbi:GspE/PulE family protein [Parathalassolituus penaei]|uniref:GspE/PulE family protein n=1 Tax=Parathalassolituus penaei TaxID=2997323 RepID=A0A9X3EAX7_9GAMM|nr:GspE/PulE family protein [Parathalassolituus penaei]MCY0964184.1 GspE/PulE family protein [Parathalassolituus penaei]